MWILKPQFLQNIHPNWQDHPENGFRESVNLEAMAILLILSPYELCFELVFRSTGAAIIWVRDSM